MTNPTLMASGVSGEGREAIPEGCPACGALPCDWAVGVVGWQPITTAPRDGREVLLAFGFGTGDVPPPLVCAWDGAWNWLIVGAEIEVLTPATHWMPLPPPPGADA